MTRAVVPILAVVLVGVWNFGRTSALYTEEDIEIIVNLGFFHATRYFAFLQSEEDPTLAKVIKIFSRRRLMSSALKRNDLNEFLEDPSKWKVFFQKKILIATMEYINFTYVSQKVYQANSVIWVIFSRPIDEFKQFNIPPNTRLYHVQSKSNKVSVRKLYKLTSESEMIADEFGKWSGSRLLSTSEKDSPSKLNYRNISLRILMHKYTNDEENCILTQNLILYKMRCFHTEMIEILSRTLNFNLNNVRYLDMNFPYFGINGSLTEVFLALQKNEVDLSGCTYTVSPERQQIYDFAWPTFSPRSMLYIQNEPAETFWQAYIKPLDLKVHYTIILWIVISGVVIEAFQNVRAKKFRLRIFATMKSILMSLQVFCNQSFPQLPHWCADRIVYILTSVFVVLIYQGYCAKLISSITVYAPNIPFLTFDDLVKDGGYKVMTLIEGFHQIVFIKFIRSAELEHILIKDEDLPENSQEAISKLCADQRLTYIEFRENIVQHDIECQITEIPKPVFSYHMGLALPKNSPYRDSISLQISRFHTHGVLNRMKRHLLSYKKLKNPETEGFVSVTLGQVSFPFFILAFGIFLSFSILAIEIFCMEHSKGGFRSGIPKTFTMSHAIAKWKFRIKGRLTPPLRRGPPHTAHEGRPDMVLPAKRDRKRPILLAPPVFQSNVNKTCAGNRSVS